MRCRIAPLGGLGAGDCTDRGFAKISLNQHKRHEPIRDAPPGKLFLINNQTMKREVIVSLTRPSLPRGARLGARRVVAIDLDPRAPAAVTYNTRANSLESRIEVRGGSWYEPIGSAKAVRGRRERFDAIIAVPPQIPGPGVFGPRYGGPDGTRYLFAVIDGGPLFLEKTHGRLWLPAISPANPEALSRRLEERFKEVSMVCKTERPFAPDEHESMKKGLFDYLRTLRSAGRSDFKEIGSRWSIFRNLFICASGPRMP